MKGKCPRCGTEYDLLDTAASKAMGGLCAACWCDWHEKNIVEDRKQEIERKERSSVDAS
jgi:NMD protein affecting ribosome stability and mRNA decay